ncbi:hypothetical protein HanRHA438_Chr05g0235391 [Helianthus annuus]|nr:hypothetical protein HanRHA438_Chr05g0235391 [Helianthus annuus]
MSHMTLSAVTSIIFVLSQRHHTDHIIWISPPHTTHMTRQWCLDSVPVMSREIRPGYILDHFFMYLIASNPIYKISRVI